MFKVTEIGFPAICLFWGFKYVNQIKYSTGGLQSCWQDVVHAPEAYLAKCKIITLSVFCFRNPWFLRRQQGYRYMQTVVLFCLNFDKITCQYSLTFCRLCLKCLFNCSLAKYYRKLTKGASGRIMFRESTRTVVNGFSVMLISNVLILKCIEIIY